MRSRHGAVNKAAVGAPKALTTGLAVFAGAYIRSMTMRIDADPGLGDIRHEAIVCVRLKTTVAGSHLLEHLRAQPFVVSAWWIAADIDAVVLLSAPSMRELHRAVDDLRLLGGAQDTEAHMVLGKIGLAAH